MLATFLRSVGDQYSSNYWFHEPSAGGSKAALIMSDGNILVGDGASGYLYKLDQKGRYVWQRRSSNTQAGWTTLHEASNGEIISVGYDYIISSDVEIQRWAADGSSFVWQINYGAISQPKAAFDSSDNIYIATGALVSSRTKAVVAKFNSSGTLQWDRSFGDTVDDYIFVDVCVDGSGNVYTVMQYGAGWDGYIVKYNSSGTLQWQRKIAHSSGPGYGMDYGCIEADSSGNVYAIGGASSGFNTGGIMKLNTSGTVQWQKTVSGVSILGSHMTTDDRIFVSGLVEGSSPRQQWFGELDTSGNIVWQTYLSHPTLRAGNSPGEDQLSYADGVLVGSDGAGGSSQDASTTYCIPADGTGTGNVGGGWTYATAAKSMATTTHTVSTGTRTDSAITITPTSTAYTISTPALTTNARNLLYPT